MDSDRGAQHLHAGSAGLLKDVLLVLRQAQGASPSSQDPFPSRGELAHITMKHIDAIILFPATRHMYASEDDPVVELQLPTPGQAPFRGDILVFQRNHVPSTRCLCIRL